MNKIDDNATDSTDEAHPKSNSASRRHLIVLGIAVVGLILGVVLVLTGRDDDGPPTQSTSSITTSRAALLPDLGHVVDLQAAKSMLADLDPTTLKRPSTPTTTYDSAPTSTPKNADQSIDGLQRCQTAITQQNTDRSVGPRLAASRLIVKSTPSFVVSYSLPPTQTAPAGIRVLLVDARTCRVLAAVEHTD